MHLAVTGFVSEQGGSVASANAVILRGLLNTGVQVTFFSKASFVDPRPSVRGSPLFTFVNVNNYLGDRVRARTASLGGVRLVTALADSFTYHLAISRAIKRAHAERKFDAILWLGDFARGRCSNLPTISFLQGPPGTDARSILRRRSEVARLGGILHGAKLCLLSVARLYVGLPPFHHSDHFIVGSTVSRAMLNARYKVPLNKISTLPYPIDLDQFAPSKSSVERYERRVGELRAVWLGRFVPRKRLDLFVESADEARRCGLRVALTVVGSEGFARGYNRLITESKHPELVVWQPNIKRTLVPQLFAESDVLVQPSEEENFGSSVAEAQCCGLPVIIGPDNGNRDYLSPYDVVCKEYTTHAIATAYRTVYNNYAKGGMQVCHSCREYAVSNFDAQKIVHRMNEIIAFVCTAKRKTGP